MPLADRISAVGRVRNRPLQELCRIGAKAHRRAVLAIPNIFLLLGHDVYDRVCGVPVNLGRVRVCKSQTISRKFNDGKLHAVAEAEVGNAILARILNHLNLPLHPPLAKSAGDKDARVAREFFEFLLSLVMAGRILFIFRGIQPADGNFFTLRRTCVLE